MYSQMWWLLASLEVDWDSERKERYVGKNSSPFPARRVNSLKGGIWSSWQLIPAINTQGPYLNILRIISTVQNQISGGIHKKAFPE